METYLLAQYLSWHNRLVTPRTIQQSFPWLYHARRYFEEQTHAYKEMNRRIAILLGVHRIKRKCLHLGTS